ncbi:septal ring lytic transglycosylase RlpA family protein [Nafulsella turpanensis]|uniref:septal ring lytic transglycosylase RlpA family protein n=1 Tax=Nafulsella turpanensis TaxID=1265690 RepID=UPI00034A04F1|nr:septal ring lytic transglycosylase RlpA family protein [Nafulsella turpanensis]
MNKLLLLIVIPLLFSASCGPSEEENANGADTFSTEPLVFEKTSNPIEEKQDKILPQEGRASFYANSFQGKPTASGELYDSSAFTAAHKTLPFGTRVKVTNLRNNKSVVVTINDRGPFHQKRIIDLSKAAAHELGFIDRGTTKVRLEEVE